jgi:hypothetical protein
VILQWLTLAVAILSVIIVPLLVALFRVMTKFTRLEMKLDQVFSDLQELVHDKDRVHEEITRQMTDDRKATDRRLRWLEEHLWKRGSQNAV